MSESRMRKRFFDARGMTLEQLSEYTEGFCQLQRDLPFWIGDIARYAKARWPDVWQQAFPPEVSPGMIERYRGVMEAYPKEEDRQADATYTQYMQASGRADRREFLEGIVAQGMTSDESRESAKDAGRTERQPAARWLLAVDVNYHLHRHWFSGAGVEAAQRVTDWIVRTVNRLKEKGLTDVVCCFESHRNFRKELTKDWEDRYKDRPPKDAELVQQIHLVEQLLEQAGFRCVSVDGYESDDLLASYAVQFPGRVTILTQDKDLRQCLSDKCNMLTDVEWEQDETSGDMMPQYKWLSAKQHTEATGLRPDQQIGFQMLMGDATDGIKGAPNIGETGAKNIIKEFGSVDAAIQAARNGDERLLSMRRGKIMASGLLELEKKLEITRQLVTLSTDCAIPLDTRV